MGLNHSRHGVHLARDVVDTDVQLVITEPRHQAQLDTAIEKVDLAGGVLVSDRFPDDDDPPVAGESLGRELEAAWAAHSAGAPNEVASAEPDVDVLWALLFTSGTSAAPKAVRCTQYRLLTTGNRMAMMLELTPDDVGYAAMPLFHTNSLMSGFAPALVAGASLSLARRFSASRFLPDVRRYGATWFNYTGKVLTYLMATPSLPDDADNPLPVAFGNEGSPGVIEAAGSRFGLRIIDVFGSTEGAIALDRTGERPPSSIGRLRQGIMVVDEEGRELPPAPTSTPMAGSRMPTVVWVRSSTPLVLVLSRATTATRRPCAAPPAMAGIGVATLATSMMRVGSTSRDGPLTGCGSTARTSRRRRSKRSSVATRTSCWCRYTACPILTRVIR